MCTWCVGDGAAPRYRVGEGPVPRPLCSPMLHGSRYMDVFESPGFLATVRGAL
jgi:hypothetical protein